MSAQQPTQPTPSLPVQSGPQPAIPHTDIPHMGTSQAAVAHSDTNQANTAQANTNQASPVQMPPLPTGITQEAIDAAIAHVQQTGNTDSIPPEVLGAACAQLEAQAKAQGVDLNQPIAQPQEAPPPSNYVEAAMLDKKNVMDGFGEQRDALKGAVAEQREALQKSYKDALGKVGDGGSLSSESLAELATAVKDLDPNTLALINAMGAMSNNPSILSSVVWIEIIRSIRNLIASEVKKQLERMANPTAV